jgi:hypothetical protein
MDGRLQRNQCICRLNQRTADRFIRIITVTIRSSSAQFQLPKDGKKVTSLPPCMPHKESILPMQQNSLSTRTRKE